MENVTIAVNVKNGRLPIDLLLIVTNLDTPKVVIGEEFTTPFKKSFNLSSGNYSFFINGLNPDGGSTEIILTGDFLAGPFPREKTTTTNPHVIGIFKGKI